MNVLRLRYLRRDFVNNAPGKIRNIGVSKISGEFG